jgi:glycosyltransferase involved in cell wall biosynthesis
MDHRNTFENDGISLVLPVYNEAESLPGVLQEAAGVLRDLKRPFEILCVNDGSNDESQQVLEKEASHGVPEVRIIRFDQNLGQSAAFAAGFQQAHFPWVVTMDADGQNDPHDIPKLFDAIGSADICCGYRAVRNDTWSKRIGSLIGNGIRNRFLHSQVRDTGCSLKLFRRSTLQGLPLWEGMHRFLPDLCQIVNQATLEQIPVSHRPRKQGVSKYSNWGRLLKTLPDLMGMRWLRNRTLPRSAFATTETGNDA